MCKSFPLSQEDKGRLCSQGGKQWRMQGRVPPFRIVDQTEAPKAEKIFLGDPPRPLSKGLDDRSPPPFFQGLDPALVNVCINVKL